MLELRLCSVIFEDSTARTFPYIQLNTPKERHKHSQPFLLAKTFPRISIGLLTTRRDFKSHSCTFSSPYGVFLHTQLCTVNMMYKFYGSHCREKGLVKQHCVLIARASDKINEIHGARPQMPHKFSFGLQQTPVCFTRGGGGGGGGVYLPCKQLNSW